MPHLCKKNLPTCKKMAQKKIASKIENCVKMWQHLSPKKGVVFPQEFGQLLTVYLFYKNVMLQLCENLSQKNSLELLIVQKEFT